MGQKPIHRGAAFAVSILAMPLLYVASYIALADHRVGTMGARHRHYRLGGELSERLFEPLEFADRRIRGRAYWGPIGLLRDGLERQA